MVSYLNVHDALEQRRRASKEASTSDRPGPRAIVRPVPLLEANCWVPKEYALVRPPSYVVPDMQHPDARQTGVYEASGQW